MHSFVVITVPLSHCHEHILGSRLRCSHRDWEKRGGGAVRGRLRKPTLLSLWHKMTTGLSCPLSEKNLPIRTFQCMVGSIFLTSLVKKNLPLDTHYLATFCRSVALNVTRHAPFFHRAVLKVLACAFSVFHFLRRFLSSLRLSWCCKPKMLIYKKAISVL